jgi:hypothetical protein
MNIHTLNSISHIRPACSHSSCNILALSNENILQLPDNRLANGVIDLFYNLIMQYVQKIDNRMLTITCSIYMYVRTVD